MTDELKSCPFCGGKAALVYVDSDAWQVICDDCGSCSDYYDGNPPGRKEAIEAWNTRRIEDELDKKNGCLIGTCHDLHDIVEEFRAECDQKDLEIKRLREALEEIQDSITLLNTEDVLEYISDKINQTLNGKKNDNH